MSRECGESPVFRRGFVRARWYFPFQMLSQGSVHATYMAASGGVVHAHIHQLRGLSARQPSRWSG